MPRRPRCDDIQRTSMKLILEPAALAAGSFFGLQTTALELRRYPRVVYCRMLHMGWALENGRENER